MRKKIFSFIIIFSFFVFPKVKLNSQIPEFKMLVLQFTDSMVRRAFYRHFSYRRWKRRFRRISGERRIARYILLLERKIRRRMKKSSWDDKRRQWRRRLKHSVSISEIAHAIYLLEINLQWNATRGYWNRRRRFWVRRIKSLY